MENKELNFVFLFKLLLEKKFENSVDFKEQTADATWDGHKVFTASAVCSFIQWRISI